MSSLQHILASDPGEPIPPMSNPQPAAVSPPPEPSAVPMTMATSAQSSNDAAPDSVTGTPKRKAEEAFDDSLLLSTTASGKRQLNSTMANVSSVYSGNKIKHLKKEDGIPLWRKDIQYDFLCNVFYDKTRCFTRYSDGSKEHTFAEIYIDAMARSSKTSKILKEKLLQDQEGAICMAMVCLLVNVGRMNTTLNFFPEMRAQLRTYHSIPALQAQQDPNAYKQLQDAPRLKSILKGATEDEPQPSTLDEIRAATIPRTNPVNLIFVMSQYAPKITESHFQAPRDFFDLVMRSTLSSASRARAFLWLIWWYLESDFSATDALQNPFGPGQYGDGEDGPDSLALKVPALESLTEEQAALENVDSQTELHFGEAKRKERIAILASEPSPAMTALKRARKEKGLSGFGVPASDDERSEAGHWKASESRFSVAGRAFETGSEYTRSPSPALGRSLHAASSAAKGADVRIHDLLNTTDVDGAGSPLQTPVAGVKKGPGRGNWRRNKPKIEAGRNADGAHHVPLLPNTAQFEFLNEPMSVGRSFQTPTSQEHMPTPSYPSQKRSRGMTQHQSAVINHRRMQIDYLLDRRIRHIHADTRAWRDKEGTVLRAWKRIRSMPVEYDSEEEDATAGRRSSKDAQNDKHDDWRPADHEDRGFFDVSGNPKRCMAGVMRTKADVDDVGEEYRTYARTFRRMIRRLDRWGEVTAPGKAMQRRRENETKPQPLPREVKDFERIARKSEYTPVATRGRGRVKKMSNRGGRAVSGRGGRGSRGGAKARGGGPRKSRVSQVAPEVQQERDLEPEPDFEQETVLAVDLDDEDREMLGEVDADESEIEDEDDEMADD